jgi:hypothetical protein
MKCRGAVLLITAGFLPLIWAADSLRIVSIQPAGQDVTITLQVPNKCVCKIEGAQKGFYIEVPGAAKPAVPALPANTILTEIQVYKPNDIVRVAFHFVSPSTTKPNPSRNGETLSITFHSTGQAVAASHKKPNSPVQPKPKDAPTEDLTVWLARQLSTPSPRTPAIPTQPTADLSPAEKPAPTRPSEPKPEATLAPPVFDASAVNLRISLGKPEDLPQIIAKCHGYLGFASPSDPDNVANLYRAPDGRKEPLRVGLISLDNYFALKIVSNPPPWIEEVRKHNRLSPAMDAYMLLPLDFRNHIVQDEILRVAGETNAHGGKITAATLVFTADSDLGFTIKDVEVQ